jgi:GT2 family glycosyltransferase
VRRKPLPAAQTKNHEEAVTESVCVITPCFNAGRFLQPCLDSVASQGIHVSKHIVMDGGSTDGSAEILRERARLDGRLIWRSEHDDGQSDALNKALALVDTSYFAWLNADDCFLPEKLGALVHAADSYRRPSIVYGDYHVIDADGAVLKRRRQPSFNYWDCLYSYLTVQNCAAIFRTDLCRSTGGFDDRLNFCMDYDLVLRLAAAAPVSHVREYVGCFRHHEAAKTAQLQHVCAMETEMLRIKFSRRAAPGLRWRYWAGKARVASRMLSEGCIPSRLQSWNRHR